MWKERRVTSAANPSIVLGLQIGKRIRIAIGEERGSRSGHAVHPARLRKPNEQGRRSGRAQREQQGNDRRTRHHG